jgi:hypothetical protein
MSRILEYLRRRWLDVRQIRLWLLVNFALVSLIDQAWTFQQISLEGSTIREERLASDETRFARLKDEVLDETEANGKGRMLAIVIRHLDAIDGAGSLLNA